MGTVAGSGVCAFADGVGSAANFCTPIGIAVVSNGLVYVLDSGNRRVRFVSTAGKNSF